jgi:hypothetical protein
MPDVKHQSSARPIGHVRVSTPVGMNPDVPPVLYHREGLYFIPDGDDKFARQADEREVLRGGQALSDGPNHITFAGRFRTAELIGGVSAGFPRLVGVGDAGTSPGTNVPLPPNDQATALVHEIVRLGVTQRVMNVDVPSITFVALFQSAGSYQFNQPGQAQITEVGLFTPDNVLCAVYNFAPIPVDVHRLGVLVEWEWAVL